MMLYTKYESSGPCSFRQEDFWKLHFENLFFDPWPTYATNWNGLNNFDRGPPRDHSCEIWSTSNKRFQRRFCLKKLLTHRRTHAHTDRRRTPDIEGSQKLTEHKHEHFVLRWAKNHMALMVETPHTQDRNGSKVSRKICFKWLSLHKQCHKHVHS